MTNYNIVMIIAHSFTALSLVARNRRFDTLGGASFRSWCLRRSGRYDGGRCRWNVLSRQSSGSRRYCCPTGRLHTLSGTWYTRSPVMLVDVLAHNVRTGWLRLHYFAIVARVWMGDRHVMMYFDVSGWQHCVTAIVHKAVAEPVAAHPLGRQIVPGFRLLHEVLLILVVGRRLDLDRVMIEPGMQRKLTIIVWSNTVSMGFRNAQL